MGQVMGPRHGSMQYWPRKRARRIYPRVRSWVNVTAKDVTLLGFAGYKVGMTHIQVVDNRKNSKTKGSELSLPVTIIECPPLKIYSVRGYTKDGHCLTLKKEVVVGKDKELARKVVLSKKPAHVLEGFQANDYLDIRVSLFTMPKLTGIGKKKPELFEVALSGKNEEKLAFIKNHLDKEIAVKDIFKPGQFLDFHTVTKGKGYQGPVKRFGVRIRSHKAEKTKRGPGSLGAWCGQGHMMYRVAHAGQMGYHTRTEYNKWLLKISDNPAEVNAAGGFLNYGVVRNPFILVHGSVGGNKKRLVRFNPASRAKINHLEAPSVEAVSLQSQQGK